MFVSKRASVVFHYFLGPSSFMSIYTIDGVHSSRQLRLTVAKLEEKDGSELGKGKFSKLLKYLYRYHESFDVSNNIDMLI